MITGGGTGVQAETSFYTSVTAPGVYTVVIKAAISDSQAGVVFRKTGQGLGTQSQGSQPYIGDLWVEPGDVFTVEEYAGVVGWPPAVWSFEFFLYSKSDIAYEAP